MTYRCKPVGWGLMGCLSLVLVACQKNEDTNSASQVTPNTLNISALQAAVNNVTENAALAYQLALRAKYTDDYTDLGAQGGAVHSALIAYQLLLIDPVDSATAPIVIDSGTNTFPVYERIYQENKDASGQIVDRFARYVVYVKAGKLFKIDLLKTATPPVAIQLSNEANATDGLKFLDNAVSIDETVIEYSANGANGPTGRFVRLNMSLNDSPLAGRPAPGSFSPELGWRLQGTDGSTVGWLEQTFVGEPPLGVINHYDARGSLVKEVARGVAGSSASVLWKSADVSVLEQPFPSADGSIGWDYVYYRPGAQSSRIERRPDNQTSFQWFAEDESFLYFQRATEDYRIQLFRTDKRDLQHVQIRPDIAFRGAGYNSAQWPSRIFEDANRNLNNLMLAGPEYASQILAENKTILGTNTLSGSGFFTQFNLHTGTGAIFTTNPLPIDGDTTNQLLWIANFTSGRTEHYRDTTFIAAAGPLYRAGAFGEMQPGWGIVHNLSANNADASIQNGFTAINMSNGQKTYLGKLPVGWSYVDDNYAKSLSPSTLAGGTRFVTLKAKSGIRTSTDQDGIRQCYIAGVGKVNDTKPIVGCPVFTAEVFTVDLMRQNSLKLRTNAESNPL